MILGMSYCQLSTLSIIINRDKFKVETVVASDGPDFKSCIDSLNSDDPYFRIPTLFIEKLSTALSLTNKLPTDRKYKVVIFDTPDNLTFANINLLDAEFISDSVWKPTNFTPSEFNSAVLKGDLVSVNEIKSLKERRFKPVRKYNDSNVASAVVSLKDIGSLNKQELVSDSEDNIVTKLRGKAKVSAAIDDDTFFNEETHDDYTDSSDDYAPNFSVVDEDSSDDDSIVSTSSPTSNYGIIENIIKGVSSAVANKYCRYIVGIDEKNKSIPERISDFCESENGIRIFEAFVDFYKNDLSIDDAAIKHSCSEDDLNIIIDNIEDLSDIKFVRSVKIVHDKEKVVEATKKDECKTVLKSKVKEKTQVPVEQAPVPVKAPVPQPMPMNKAKSIVDAIEFAYTNITHESMDKLQEVVAKYIAYIKGTTKSSFNAAVKSSLKAGANEEYIQQIDKLIHSKYGESLLIAYTDLVLYSATESDACKLLKVNEADLAMITYYCPVENAEKDRYNKKIPLVLFRKHGGNPKD